MLLRASMIGPLEMNESWIYYTLYMLRTNNITTSFFGEAMNRIVLRHQTYKEQRSMTNNTVLTYTNRGVAYRITLNAETNLSRTNVLTSNIQLMIIQLIRPFQAHFRIFLYLPYPTYISKYRLFNEYGHYNIECVTLKSYRELPILSLVEDTGRSYSIE